LGIILSHNENDIEKHLVIMETMEEDEFVAAAQLQFKYWHDPCSLIISENEVESPCDVVELELTLG